MAKTKTVIIYDLLVSEDYVFRVQYPDDNSVDIKYGSTYFLDPLYNYSSHDRDSCLQRVINKLQKVGYKVPTAQVALFMGEEKKINKLIMTKDEKNPNKPDSPFGYFERGYASKERGDFNRAILDFTQAIKQAINLDSGIIINRGFAYSNIGNYELARADCDKAIELNPKYAWAYVCMGYMYSEKGEYDPAITNFTKAIELDPEDKEVQKSGDDAYSQWKKKSPVKHEFPPESKKIAIIIKTKPHKSPTVKGNQIEEPESKKVEINKEEAELHKPKMELIKKRPIEPVIKIMAYNEKLFLFPLTPQNAPNTWQPSGSSLSQTRLNTCVHKKL
jgi:tetratricopeptide (TPR) repeat protein